ncbi:MAG TPA: hypothetical protein VFK09_04230 [Gemmatimonadales bacterium]|nr:hypothetical protein [Gemmatimonadales bacterium]
MRSFVCRIGAACAGPIASVAALACSAPHGGPDRPAGAIAPATGSVYAAWRAHGDGADSARRAGDWAGYRHHLDAMWRIAPGHPRLTWAYARAAARLGERDGALRWLERYAAAGLPGDLDGDSALAPLAADPRGGVIRARLARNAEPVRGSVTAFTLPAADLVTEDLAWDGARRRLLVSSVRERRVLALAADGSVTDFVPEGREGVWGMYALAADSARGVLWATTASGPPARGAGASEPGRTALLEYDLASGRLLRRLEPPPREGAERERTFGDLALAPDGSVLVTDSRAGELWRARPAGDRLELVVPAGTLVSPQQPAVLPGGRAAIVPDYLRGLALVDLATGEVTWPAIPEDLAPTGIDGLLPDGGSLVAFQNGVSPARVLRIELRGLGRRVTGWRVLEAGTPELGEPTHGVRADGAVYFIANAGWERFGEDGAADPRVPPVHGVIRRLR